MDQSLSRKRSRADWVVDTIAFLGAVLVGMILFDENRDDPLPNWLFAADFYTGMLLCLLLWFRRRWPIQLAVLAAVVSVYSETSGIAALILTMTVAVHFRLRVTLLITALNVLSVIAYALVREKTDPVGIVIVTASLLYVGAIGWGLYVRSRRQLLQTLRERAERAETVARLQAEQGQLRAREEIAREMHDVLGHRLSLLSVHAGALAYRPDASTEEIAGAAEIIRSSAHQALQDLREVIGVLRAPVGELPQPTFADLPVLIEGAQRAGVPVELKLDAPGALPEHVGRTAYRIVQEGLTNAMKHAPGAPVRIRVTGAAGNGLTVDLSNPAPRRTSSGEGQGLTGLAERAALVEGRLEHGWTPDGDFRLTAWLPWPA
ncbi:histidine kinase [Kribbella flavida DSM 17836]|uniref:histidine kinase n=1 Tax=Kribbella flavida (strain DSM 17836 / JCM 10339 / NBRC 14399) TaxID=479435 RepID=D2PP97_KRIFD|nr:histidine kinase [Kribbella flavida]ADB34693.1 histidine kinase [Kribbella flavida DSM 17836]